MVDERVFHSTEDCEQFIAFPIWYLQRFQICTHVLGQDVPNAVGELNLPKGLPEREHEGQLIVIGDLGAGPMLKPPVRPTSANKSAFFS